MNKKESRLKRAKRTRYHLKDLGVYRLTVHRTLKHIFAQILAPEGGKVIACASTLESDIRSQIKGTGNQAAAEVVGRIVAERGRSRGIESVGFDRSGFQYHGRVKALAEAARVAGLRF